jgi:hypothetical protein
MFGYVISVKNKIIVKNHEVKSFDILYDLEKKKINIFIVYNNEVLYKNKIVLNALMYGHVQVLEWFKNSGYVFKNIKKSIYIACFYGHVQLLEWFKKSGFKIKYDKEAVFCASENGHAQILEWFKNSCHDFKYDEYNIYNAIKHNNINIVKWFKKYNYEFKYPINLIFICDNLTIEMFDLLKKYNYHFKYTMFDFNIANHNKKFIRGIIKFICPKKIVKWNVKNSILKKIKILKFKTRNKYLKGYNKN